jgi:presenilin-like A22 family membrane protease
MKHNWKATLIIVLMFLIAQFIGLLVIHNYDLSYGKTSQKLISDGAISNETNPDMSIIRENLPPEIEIKETVDYVSIISSIIVALIFAVILFLILSRIKANILLKIWFTFVVFTCLSISISLILYPSFGFKIFNLFDKRISIAEIIAVPIAIFFTYFKIFKRNMLAHNFSELLIYPGLAVIFIPIVNLPIAILLLVIISVYDMIAVWKTKHMIKMAKFQMNELKVFTGFLIPYIKKEDRIKIEKIRSMKLSDKQKNDKLKNSKIKVNMAALGGGDVAFPMIFAGVILLSLGLIPAIITILTTTLSLLVLLFFSEKGKFYPAMPFLSVGCLIGLIIGLLI